MRGGIREVLARKKLQGECATGEKKGRPIITDPQDECVWGRGKGRMALTDPREERVRERRGEGCPASLTSPPAARPPSPPQMASSSLSPVRCWGLSPGWDRPSRTRCTTMAVPVMAARAVALRRIWPTVGKTRLASDP